MKNVVRVTFVVLFIFCTGVFQSASASDRQTNQNQQQNQNSSGTYCVAVLCNDEWIRYDSRGCPYCKTPDGYIGTNYEKKPVSYKTNSQGSKAVQ